jgi:hypothetical protein
MRSSRSLHTLSAGLLIFLTACSATDASVSSMSDRPSSSHQSMSPGMSMSSGSSGMSMSPGSPSMSMSPGMPMSPGMSMRDAARTSGPSPTARMICGDEVRGDVSRIFANPALSSGQVAWADRLFTCAYQLPDGKLVLSVKDSANARTGHRYFLETQRRAEGAKPLGGLLDLGLPSYETPDGTVVFLKDGKTLRVDASQLPHRTGAKGKSRADVAYAVAAAVVACWSE